MGHSRGDRNGEEKTHKEITPKELKMREEDKDEINTK